MQELDQKETERRSKLKAIKNYLLSDNFKNLEKEAEDRKSRAKATVVTAYLSPAEDGGEFTEVKKYNHKNKFAWGIQAMEEAMGFIDDSEGGKLLKERIQEGIDNSEEHIGCATVKIFPGSGSVVEYRYTDLEFADSDKLIYKAQVWNDSVSLAKQLEVELTKEPERVSDVSEEVETE